MDHGRWLIPALLLLLAAGPLMADLDTDLKQARAILGQVDALCKQSRFAEARISLQKANPLVMRSLQHGPSRKLVQTLFRDFTVWQSRIGALESLYEAQRRLLEASNNLRATGHYTAASHVRLADASIKEARNSILREQGFPVIGDSSTGVVGTQMGPAAPSSLPRRGGGTPATSTVSKTVTPSAFGFLGWVWLIIKWIFYVIVTLVILFVLLIVILLIYFKIDEYYYEKQFADEDFETGVPPKPGAFDTPGDSAGDASGDSAGEDQAPSSGEGEAASSNEGEAASSAAGEEVKREEG